MTRIRNKRSWFLSLLKAGGLVTLFLLPLTSKPLPLSGQSVPVPLPEPSAYDRMDRA